FLLQFYNSMRPDKAQTTCNQYFFHLSVVIYKVDNGGSNEGNLFIIQFGVHWKGDDLLHQLVRDLEIFFLISRIFIGLLEMQRDGIINTARNSIFIEMFYQGISINGFDF